MVSFQQPLIELKVTLRKVGTKEDCSQLALARSPGGFPCPSWDRGLQGSWEQAHEFTQWRNGEDSLTYRAYPVPFVLFLNIA